MSTTISDIDDLQRISVQRPVYTKCSLQEAYTFNDDYKLEDDAFIHNTRRCLTKNLKINRSCMRNFLFDLFPIIKWIPKYDFRKDVFKDLIAGLTVGVIQVRIIFILFSWFEIYIFLIKYFKKKSWTAKKSKL